MGQITIEQIFSIFAMLAGAIGSIGIITGVIIKFWKWINKKETSPILDEMIKMEERIMKEMKSNDAEINNKIDKLGEDIELLDINHCKDVIVSFISAVESGTSIDTVFEQRAYEAMERYTNVLHQNSYIHKRWEEVVGEDKEN